MDLEDFVRSGNQGVDPALYDVENAAIDRSEILWTALQELATWVDLVLLDLGLIWWGLFGQRHFVVLRGV